MDSLKFLFSTSFYPPYHLGGDATHVKYLAEELAKNGHEVHVIYSIDAYRIKRKNSNILNQEPDKENIFFHRIESPLKRIDPLMVYASGRSFYVQKKFSEVIREVCPDIVHHHNISLLGYSILEKKSNYISLYTAHDYWLICQTNNLMRNKRKICSEKQCYSCVVNSRRFPQLWRNLKSFKNAVKSIDLLISPSDFVRKRLLQEIKLKSITLPNFAPTPPVDILPSNFSNYFLYVGMLEQHKGILNLLNIFKELKDTLKARLIIVGGGSLSEYVSDFINSNSLNEKILFLGFVNNKKLYQLYLSALALIIPSIWPENAPLVALEALSFGTPVIASNNGGLPEIIRKIDDRLIFSDLPSLKEKLLNFSKEDFSSSRIKEIYERNFSPKGYVNKYIEIIHDIR
jgi:glycosyltransferase involved in cell wall biosynthesis